MKKVIFMGTPAFSRTVLQGLIDSQAYEIMAVVTQPDRPVGRKRVITPSPVKELAQAYGIPVLQPEKLAGSDQAKTIIEMKPDLIITAAFGQFLPKSILNAPKYGAINVHASLLPKYRGGAPIHYAIWKGEKETGISLIYMTPKMDAGNILAQASLPILDRDDVADVFAKMADLGRDLLLKTLPSVFAGTNQAWPQNEAEATFSPNISKEEEEIQWNQTAIEIDRHVRAFRPFPSTFTRLKGQRFKIWAGRPITGDFPQGQVGQIVASTEDQLIVQAGQNTYFAIEEVQPNGKKRMSVKQYLNGMADHELVNQVFEMSSGHEG